MKYTKGKRGPETTHQIEVIHASQSGIATNPMVKGVLMVTLKTGKRSVGFIAQGKNASAFLAERDKSGSSFTATMRWTARDNVTLTAIGAQDDLDAAA